MSELLDRQPQDAEASPLRRQVDKSPGTPLPYQTPTVADLGSAVELMQQNITGRLRDGNGGWYVWGS